MEPEEPGEPKEPEEPGEPRIKGKTYLWEHINFNEANNDSQKQTENINDKI